MRLNENAITMKFFIKLYLFLNQNITLKKNYRKFYDIYENLIYDLIIVQMFIF